MPLTIINPRLITISDHNLGKTREEQINNGVVDPDPLPYDTRGFLLPDGTFRPYQAGDRVSSNTDRKILVNRAGERFPYSPATEESINLRLAQLTDEYTLIDARSVYVYLADDSTGYIRLADRVFIPNTSTTSASAGLRLQPGVSIPEQSPDSEQNRRDDKYQPNPRNPYWSYERRVNELSFTDERSSIKTGKFDDRTSTGGLEFVINSPAVGDSIALIGIEASEISYRFGRNGVEYKGPRNPKLTDLADVRNWREYFFNDISFPRNFLITNLPTFNHLGEKLTDDDSLIITLRNPGAVVSIGQVVFGNRIDIGNHVLSSGYKTEELSFSDTGVDEFGVQFRTVRGSVTRNSYAVEILRENHEAEQRKLELVSDGRPAVFIQVGLSQNPDGEYKSNYGELQFGYRQIFTITPIQGKSKKSLITGNIDTLL